jgi:hypothetical protein
MVGLLVTGTNCVRHQAEASHVRVKMKALQRYVGRSPNSEGSRQFKIAMVRTGSVVAPVRSVAHGGACSYLTRNPTSAIAV